MHLSSELLDQLITDRQQDRHSAAAAQRLAEASPARRRIAQSLRRAADRLDSSAVGARADPAGAESARPQLNGSSGSLRRAT